MTSEPILVFGGSGSPRLAQEIAGHLGVQVARGETLRFSEGNLFVRALENVWRRKIYPVQSTGYPSNDNFIELLFWVDALRRASVRSSALACEGWNSATSSWLRPMPGSSECTTARASASC